MQGKPLAEALGWFSLGLGLTEALLPDRLRGRLGVQAGVIRSFGLREIAVGVAILLQPRKPAWLWTRVGGDVLDLAVLGLALGTRKNNNRDIGIAMGAVAAVTALDVCCARQLKH